MGESDPRVVARRAVHAEAMKGGPAIYVTAGGAGGSIDVDQARALIDDLVRAIIEVGGRRSSLGVSGIRDVCAAIAFLYAERIDDGELVEALGDLCHEDADRLRRVIALRDAQGGTW